MSIRLREPLAPRHRRPTSMKAVPHSALFGLSAVFRKRNLTAAASRPGVTSPTSNSQAVIATLYIRGYSKCTFGNCFSSPNLIPDHSCHSRPDPAARQPPSLKSNSRTIASESFASTMNPSKFAYTSTPPSSICLTNFHMHRVAATAHLLKARAPAAP